jgi:hypothetical protein
MLLDDLYTYLGHQSGLVTIDWPLYLGYLPDEQDQCTGLFETGGMPADTLLRENERVSFQLRVRGNRFDYAVVRRKWQDYFDALQDSQPAAGYAYVQAAHLGPLVFGDPSGRVNMTANFLVMKARYIFTGASFPDIDSVPSIDDLSDVDNLQD